MKAPRVQLSSDFASSTIKYFASVNWHIFKSFYDDLCCLSTACFRCQNSKTLKRRATRNFSWAGEISWNRGTSIKASCTTQKKRPRREKIDVFCPRYSTNCILNENLTHRCMQGTFSSKIRAPFWKIEHFFQFPKQTREDPPLIKGSFYNKQQVTRSKFENRKVKIVLFLLKISLVYFVIFNYGNFYCHNFFI